MVATFMITPLSRPLWEYLPLLAKTQFPWRFLSVQALFAAAVTGGIARERGSEKARRQEDEEARKRESEGARRRKSEEVQKRKNEGRARSGDRPKLVRGILYVLLSALSVSSALLNLNLDRLLIASEDVTWDNLLLYESFTGNIGTTIRYEYLPADVAPRLYIAEAVVDGVNAARPRAADGMVLSAALLERTPARQRWQVELAHAGPVTFPLHWWPGWRATVDGAPTDVHPLTGSGRLTMELPAGAQTVTLRLGNTPLRTVALLLSGVTALGCVLALFVRRRDEGLAEQRADLPFAIRHLLLAISLLTLAVGLPATYRALQGGMSTGAPATFFDFVQQPYPHRGPVDFGAVQLDAVNAPAEAAPGEQITVTASWSRLFSAPLTATLRLVSPATPRHNAPYTLAETHARITPEQELVLMLPADLARGLYLLELHVHNAAEEFHGVTAQGRGMGALYVGAVRVLRGPRLPVDAPVVATLGNGELTLHSVTAEQPRPTLLRLKMGWSTSGTARNWSLSLRLRDMNGRQLVQQDLQPGYGYLPTTLWSPGELVTDYLVLTLPEGLAPGEYTLQVITYLEATLAGGGEIEVPLTLHKPALFNLREACCEQVRKGHTVLSQAGGVALLGLGLPAKITEGEGLTFYPEWNALEEPAGELTAQWTLLAPDATVVAEHEVPLAPGSRTTDWPRFTWVRARVEMELPPQLIPGPYQLELTLLEAGKSLTRSVVSESIPVTLRARSFESPPPPFPQEAQFGEVLQLLGYDYEFSLEKLRLILWWQAKRAPAQDYKRFVHLYAVGSGAVVAQDDAMPRAWSYPTSWWAAGEVVSETVTLDLHGLAAGEYHLGVGWYDAQTGQRLPASEGDDGRVMLREVRVDLGK
ncbi:MAG: hypothetical protein U9Q70_04370 [Chloroflexota bacterium]|nr:hypothetical protein [Chloroflexota bacterium]